MKQLKQVRILCTIAVFIGIFLAAVGHIIAGLAMLAGAFILELNFFRCPLCKRRLDTRFRLHAGSRCPYCHMEIR